MVSRIHQISGDWCMIFGCSLVIEWFVVVAVPPVSVKIESCSNSSSFSHATGASNHLSSCQGNETSSYGLTAKSQPSTQTHKTSCKISTCQPDDACCPHGAAAKAGKSRCTSPRLVSTKRRRSGSRSRTPTTSHPARSRSHHSRHSVDIKTECTTPTLHKKSSRFHWLLTHCYIHLLAVD